jgi:coenzyme PQQ precursor peptide PqqA
VQPAASGRSILTAALAAFKLRRLQMKAWKKPKLVEVPVSMEINMYACATRK